MTTKMGIVMVWIVMCAAMATAGGEPDPLAHTVFYVDPDYAGSADGSASAPWPSLNLAAWTAINTALAGAPVTVYFSARAAVADTNQVSSLGIDMYRTNNSPNRLTIDGMSMYNTDDANPSWLPYTGSSRFEIRYGYSISSYLVGVNQDYVTIRGFKAIGGYGAYGGQAFVYWGGNHVVIENNEFMHDPTTTHGANFQFGYAHLSGGGGNGGNTDITIRSNLIHDTYGEAMYIGGSENTGLPAHSNVLVEGNVIYNVGVYGGEGDGIDIKDGLVNVLVRNNICHNNQGGNADGISSMSHFVAEGNVMYNLAGHGISFGTYWGTGFTGVVVRGNFLYNNAGCGIYMGSDYSNRPIVNTLIENNTIYGNTGTGVGIGSTDGSVSNITVINNIIMKNSAGLGGWGTATYSIRNNDIYANTNADYTYPFSYDPELPVLNMSTNPVFADTNNPASPDFYLQAGSPCIDAGAFATAAANTGSGTQMPVGNAWMFTDGFGVGNGDLVQLQGQTVVARITNIDHTAGILTLDRSLAWTNGQGVSVSYCGSAPDAGASEYLPPPVLTISSVASGILVKVSSVYGRLYSGLWNSDLLTTNWSCLASNVPGTGEQLEMVDTNGPAMRFYRVRVLR